jgi:hypothetical protein
MLDICFDHILFEVRSLLWIVMDEDFTLFNDQTANWLLFSAGLVAAFGGQLARISCCPSACVPHGQGGTAIGTLADCPAGTPTKKVGRHH